jgi:hypothetical protein
MFRVHSYDFVGFCQWLISNDFIDGDFAKLPAQIQESLIDRYQQVSKLRDEYNDKPIQSNYIQSTGVRQNGRVIRFDDLVDRFRGVPCHALFVYTSEDEILDAYLSKNTLALDGMSGETCDIYTSELQRSNREDAYTQLEVLTTLPGFTRLLPNKLPLLHIWSKETGVTLSLAHYTDTRQLKGFLRQVFSFLQTINRSLLPDDVEALKSLESKYIHLRNCEAHGVSSPYTPSLFETKTIFISYRRDDSQDVVGRMYDKLVGRYGAVSVIRDIDSLTIGRPFPEALDDAVATSAIILVIIGKQWVTLCNDDGTQRLADSNDFVRREVIRAIESHKSVVPVLVAGAEMPAKKDIPEPLHPLLDQHGSFVRSDPDFHHDMERLMRQIDAAISGRQF